MSDLLASSKALLDLDADGALVPHGLGGHGRSCLTWCVDEIERLRAALAAEREACARIADDHSAWARSFGAEEACEMVAKAIRSR